MDYHNFADLLGHSLYGESVCCITKYDDSLLCVTFIWT